MAGSKLLFLGDSLIDYFDWANRFPTHQVTRLGVPGETVENLHIRLGHIIKHTAPPEMIFIMTGINNAAMEDYGFTTTYEKVVAELKNAYPRAEIFVHSLLPVRLPWFAESTIERLNEILIRMTERQNVFYLDVHSRFIGLETDLLSNDGVHLTDRGYGVWSDAVADLLTSIRQ